MRGLTQKQALFVSEYLKDLNATQAAIRAGYSPKRADAIGYENLRKPEIASAIAEQQAAREVRTLITTDKILSDIEAIKQDAMQPIFDKDGNKVMADRAAALKACELQGRHNGAWNDKMAMDVKGQLNIISEFPDA